MNEREVTKQNADRCAFEFEATLCREKCGLPRDSSAHCEGVYGGHTFVPASCDYEMPREVAEATIRDKSALVLFSGGQDSTVCLAWALEHFDRVQTIGFDYDQRHAAELTQRPVILADLRSKFPAWGERLGEDHVVRIELFKSIVESALLTGRPQGTREDGLPATFVPGRNLVFLLVAGIVAKERGIKSLVGGMCETDYSGYPDCRRDTIDATQEMLCRGLAAQLNIETPLMWIDKAQTWAMARDLGGSGLVNTIVNHTHSCYNNDREHGHKWGLGCGDCDACKLRARGWALYEKAS